LGFFFRKPSLSNLSLPLTPIRCLDICVPERLQNIDPLPAGEQAITAVKDELKNGFGSAE